MSVSTTTVYSGVQNLSGNTSRMSDALLSAGGSGFHVRPNNITMYCFRLNWQLAKLVCCTACYRRVSVLLLATSATTSWALFRARLLRSWSHCSNSSSVTTAWVWLQTSRSQSSLLLLCC